MAGTLAPNALSVANGSGTLTVLRGTQPLTTWQPLPLDTDGTPYFVPGSNVGIDTDGTPYYSSMRMSPAGILLADTDGVPYWKAA